jgi:hypothetical protein
MQFRCESWDDFLSAYGAVVGGHDRGDFDLAGVLGGAGVAVAEEGRGGGAGLSGGWGVAGVGVLLTFPEVGDWF